MLKIISFIPLLVAWAIMVQAQNDDRNELAALEKQLGQIQQTEKVVGMSAGVVRSGKLIWHKGFGYSNVANKTVPDEKTAYYVSSITKCFAAVIAMQLVEKQQLDLEKTAQAYGVVAQSPQVKIKHLLSHTSSTPAGSRFAYSTRNFTILDQVLARITQKNFNQLVIEQVILPLQLTSSAPYILSPALQQKLDYQTIINRLAKPYAHLNGQAVVGNYPNFAGAGAGLLTSVADLAVFSGALDRQQLLNLKSWELMTTPQKTDKQVFPYGLGWFLTVYANQKIIWHYGYWTCNSSLILKIPSKDLTIIVLANSEGLARHYDPQMMKGDLLACPLAKMLLEWATKP